tara:strand:+ start:2076 stop:3560 length:1485 start_codon:yes stop_codon:yes gene_type:complete
MGSALPWNSPLTIGDMFSYFPEFVTRATTRITTIAAIFVLCGTGGYLSARPAQLGDDIFLLDTITLTIPQVDYEPAVYYREGDPYPHVDFQQVDQERIIKKDHTAVLMENRYIRLILLPEMGRVYSFVYKPTGHETLWRNDVVTVGGAANDTGWWLWIGGIEYTLPGDEHGTTWAMPWSWEITEDSSLRKSIRMQVLEPKTGLQESVDVSIVRNKSSFETRIRITNTTNRQVEYAHWINPQWVPGGQNVLTDRTEFIIPTDQILINKQWQENLGPSPQAWHNNPLRFISGWNKMGDLMADGLTGGFYSAYSHDTQEGIVRVFDSDKTPGVDVWTYGYHQARIPMSSKEPGAGYVEMWGGTSRTYPNERQILAPDAFIEWTELMYPYQQTRGLTFADEDVAISFRIVLDAHRVIIGLCPVSDWQESLELLTGSEAGGKPLRRWDVTASPETPFFVTTSLDGLTESELNELRLRVGSERNGWKIIEVEKWVPIPNI